jgi:hypothetical protein
MSEQCFNKIQAGLNEALEYAKMSESNIKDKNGYKAFVQALVIQQVAEKYMEMDHVRAMWDIQSDTEKIESKKLAKTVLMNALVDLSKVM